MRVRNAVAAACAACAGTAAAGAPMARHVTVVVAPGADAVIALRGYDVDGGALTARVVDAPATGTLAQLSKVFSNYGYDPKKGTAVAAGAAVTGSQNRVLYSRPEYDVERREGQWGAFHYTVSDGALTSRPGIVTLVPPSLKLVASYFDDSDDGWTVVRNGGAHAAAFDASSFGGSLNRFVVATDRLVQRAAGGLEANSSRFMFAAPPAYHGNKNAAYGGALTFTLAALAGDLAKLVKGRNHNLVELFCVTCDGNRGTTLAFPLSAAGAGKGFDGSATTLKIPLLESGGWIKDPENELLAWTAPSKCDFIEVLSNVAALRILGDLTDWYESVALDDVALTVPANSRVPVCAQLSPDASACSCDTD
ncbi:hypothetical protein M885DRAFT_626824 [Pelagophyceae sp. CCMP2097]|nr:hypothetical protein M885DRAFT_626824 [Pelagophyceae sp. CCMP2097]